MGKTNKVSYRKHQYSGHKGSRKKVKAALAFYYGENVSRCDAWGRKNIKASDMKCLKCGATKESEPTVTFSRFPLAKLDCAHWSTVRCQAWAEYCFPNENLTPEELVTLSKESKMLCSKHFASDALKKNGRLKMYAVPGEIQPVKNLQTYERKDLYAVPGKMQPVKKTYERKDGKGTMCYVPERRKQFPSVKLDDHCDDPLYDSPGGIDLTPDPDCNQNKGQTQGVKLEQDEESDENDDDEENDVLDISISQKQGLNIQHLQETLDEKPLEFIVQMEVSECDPLDTNVFLNTLENNLKWIKEERQG